MEIRLTDEQMELFQQKAKNYHDNKTAMIIDAVAQFNDIRTRRKIEVMTKLMTFYQQYEQRLGWLGGNFNQTMKRANELAVAGKLEQSYFEMEIIPRVDEIQPLIQELKDYLTNLSEKTF
ncbi:hypothetical protein [uncultured Prevotella sp.]|uniref:hypothetical protein n=1 Tax=uncultured Prevotella sp. TaxID=159272 RepID=UPI0025907AA8|nr:hypothetical protein [uncultured Prevotella sp.]